MAKIIWTENDLREVFIDSIKPYAEKRVSYLKNLFEISCKMMEHNNYHNVNLIKELFEFIELKKDRAYLQSKFGYIPRPVIAALFFQHVLFKANRPDCYVKSSEYAKQALECYEVFGAVIREISDLVVVGMRLEPPLQSEEYPIRLMHDLRNIRLAYDWERFRLNNLKLHEEFTKEIEEEDFLRLQYKLYSFLEYKTKLFSLTEFSKTLTSQAKQNISRYKQIVKDNYFALLKDDSKMFLKDETKNFAVNDIIEDKFSTIQYRIEKFNANDVKVEAENSGTVTTVTTPHTRWSIIPNTVLWSPRFKLIQKANKSPFLANEI